MLVASYFEREDSVYGTGSHRWRAKVRGDNVNHLGLVGCLSVG